MARADIGQRNAALNLTKTANLFRETSEGAPAPASPTPIGAFRTAISIREFEEMHNFRPLCRHPQKLRVGLGHHQGGHRKGTGSSNYSSHWCLGTFAPRNGQFNLREIQYYYQRYFCSARGHWLRLSREIKVMLKASGYHIIPAQMFIAQLLLLPCLISKTQNTVRGEGSFSSTDNQSVFWTESIKLNKPTYK